MKLVSSSYLGPKDNSRFYYPVTLIVEQPKHHFTDSQPFFNRRKRISHKEISNANVTCIPKKKISDRIIPALVILMIYY